MATVFEGLRGQDERISQMRGLVHDKRHYLKELAENTADLLGEPPSPLISSTAPSLSNTTRTPDASSNTPCLYHDRARGRGARARSYALST